MSKPHVLLAGVLVAMAGLARSASAVPISEDLARQFCKGSWTVNMQTDTRVCAHCTKTPAGTPSCSYFVCDDAGCDWLIVERSKPKAPWRLVKPTIPKRAKDEAPKK